MKQLRCLFVTLLLLFCAGALFAQNKVKVQIEGRSAGTVPSVSEGGVVYVDAQRTARKLNADVEIFARSKKIKITARDFAAVLTSDQAEIEINGETEKLKHPVITNGGRIMAPVEFFLKPAVGQSLNRNISFKNNTLYIEKRFTLSLPEVQKEEQRTVLTFQARIDSSFAVHKINKHTVLVEFDKAVLQREQHLRLNTPFIQSATLTQQNDRALLKVILGTQAQGWGFADNTNNRLVFEVSGTSKELLQSGECEGLSDSFVFSKQKPVIRDTKKETVLTEIKPSVLDEETEEEEETEEDILEEVNPAAALSIGAAAPPVLKKPTPPSISGPRKKMRIVVDPGHGGKDPGATKSRYREKDWNLAVGKELAKLLKKGGFDVKITRDNDTFIALSDRSKMANDFHADLFVSIHTNATKNKNANGFEVYFRSDKPTDKEAAETAALENEAMQYEEVHYNFVDALLQSLAKNEYINESSKLAGYVSNAVYKQEGIKIAVKKTSIRQANFYVLRGVQSPAILVEMGYISSVKDRGRLSQSSVQKKMAKGIYNGIVSYAKKEGRKD